MKNKKLTTYQMAVTALMAAALCVLGPLSVPIGAIPISLSNFVICLTAWLLGPKFGTLSVAVYLLIGLVGVPVFVFQMQCELGYALSVCVYPFIALDLAKIVVSCIVGALLRKRLVQAGVLKLKEA